MLELARLNYYNRIDSMMSVKSLLQDALDLYNRQRFDSAFCLALISIEAAAHLRYGDEQSSHFIKSTARRFKQFVNDETKSGNCRFKHAVDMPPPPGIRAFPEIALSELASDFDDAAPERWESEYNQWLAENKQAYEEYMEQFEDVGDNFAGERVASKWVSYLSKPRLVTTTGILYEARCELLHTGRLSCVRLTSGGDDGLSVSGADPIVFSTTWVRHVLAIAVNTPEMQTHLRS